MEQDLLSSPSFPSSVQRPAGRPLLPWTDAAIAGGILLTMVVIYFVPSNVYIDHPDPTNEIEMQNPGVQDQFIGLDAFSVNDSSAVIAQSLSLINEGDLTFRPIEIPQMMHWTIAGVNNAGSFPLPALDDRLRDWIIAGTLQPVGKHPQIVKTPNPGVYVSCFGFGGALTAAPAFALGQAIYGPLDQRPEILDRIAFTEGALLTASSAAFLFLALRASLPASYSCLLALAYALGTCVFSTSSQGMWQHSATAFFACLGLWLLTRVRESPRSAYALGVCMAMATLSRPTLGFIAIALAVQFLLTDRRAFLRYAVAGLPFAAFLLYANHTILGSPFLFGQTALTDHALEKTGVAEIWQTPIVTGLLGLLVSPSRGLFVFSPFLLAAIAGAVAVWRSPSWWWARSFAIALPIILVVEARHFDWWGGWSYGYRHLVDLSPFFVVLVGGVIIAIWRSRLLRFLFVIALLVSIGVQILGVTSNDVWRWNAPVVYILKDAKQETIRETDSFAEVVEWTSRKDHSAVAESRNIDLPKFRDRLWSWTNNQIGHYLRNFTRGARSRQAQLWNARQPHARKVAEAYRQVALAYARGGAVDRAIQCVLWAFEADSGYQQNLLTAWDMLGRAERRLDSVASLMKQRSLLAPEDQAAPIYLGYVQLEMGDLSAATDAFEGVLRRSIPEFEKRFALGSDILLRRQLESSLVRPSADVYRDEETMKQVLRHSAESRRLELAGDADGAIAERRRIDALLPEAPHRVAHEARLKYRQGEVEEAWSLLRGGAASEGRAYE